MRTRRSPRNQDILFKALFPRPEALPPTARTPRCFDCANYPRGGRSRGHCNLKGETVAGISEDRPCFAPR
jgi:hypothetical protein